MPKCVFLICLINSSSVSRKSSRKVLSKGKTDSKTDSVKESALPKKSTAKAKFSKKIVKDLNFSICSNLRAINIRLLKQESKNKIKKEFLNVD